MPTWIPTPEQVKALIPQRVGQGPFTTTSTPTTAQVQSLAVQVSAEVLAEVNGVAGDLPPELSEQARWVATLGTAAYVEQSFFPEQELGDAAPGQLLYRRYLDALDRLKTTARAVGVQGDVTTTASVAVRSATVEDAYRLDDWWLHLP